MKDVRPMEGYGNFSEGWDLIEGVGVFVSGDGDGYAIDGDGYAITSDRYPKV